MGTVVSQATGAGKLGVLGVLGPSSGPSSLFPVTASTRFGFYIPPRDRLARWCAWGMPKEEGQ